MGGRKRLKKLRVAMPKEIETQQIEEQQPRKKEEEVDKSRKEENYYVVPT